MKGEMMKDLLLLLVTILMCGIAIGAMTTISIVWLVQ